MKRIIIITAIVTFNFSILSGQLTGAGTSASPYTGTISTNLTWYPDSYPGRTIYAYNITVASGVTLTISPGVYYGGKVVFSPYSPLRTLSINSGATVIINPNIGVSVYGIVNNGNLVLESYPNESGVASLIHDVYSGSGITQVKLYLSGGTAAGGAYKWHYVAMPIANISASSFNTLNLVQYIENLVTEANNYPGWVAYDGYQYSSGNILAYTFNTLSLGKGYNYFSSAGQQFTFTGIVNTYEFSEEISLTCGSGYPDYQGYNLLGNPFASCLSWDYMVANGYTGAASDAIYFTNNGTIASYVNGIGANGGTGDIPPMQGFFVKTNSNTSLVIPRAARVHKNDQLRYKKSTDMFDRTSDTISYVRVKMRNLNDSTDLVVRLNNKATAGVDKVFDAYELSKTSGDINIWTSTAGVDYSINGLPFPETNLEIPIGVNSNTSGTYMLLANEIKKLEDFSVMIKDTFTGRIIDLKKGESLEFASSPGLYENRFVLIIVKSTTGVRDIKNSEDRFSIFKSRDALNIRYDGDEAYSIKGQVSIYDVTGRLLQMNSDLEWSGKGDLRQIYFNSGSSGIYLVELKTTGGNLVYKLII